MNDFVVTEVEFDQRKYLAAAYYEDNLLSELQMEPVSEKDGTLVGRVYKGFVESVVKNIGGAFIRVSNRHLFFLPDQKHQSIHESMPIVVQVKKDAQGRKVPVVSTNLERSGAFMVVSTKNGGISFSKKLNEDQRKAIRRWLSDAEEDPFHVLIRTNAAKASKEDFLLEYEILKEELSRMIAMGMQAGTGELLYEPAPFYMNMVRDLYQKPDRVFSEIPIVAEQLISYAKNQGEIPSHKAAAGLSLSDLYHLNRDLGRLMSKTVYLKSGAFLVIEQTEAFVSIDVNTGKCVRGKIPEETYARINREAAGEIARQIRLRNLSGMILVDFINMKREEHKEELVQVMRKAVRRDHIHTEVIDLTPLGIMEILRQKSRKPLAFVLEA